MDNFDFGVLRELRRSRDMSIAELSAASGVSGAVISKMERNQSKAELDTLLRLARVFELGAAELLNLAEAHSSRRIVEDSHDSGGFSFKEIKYRNIRCLLGEAERGAKISRPNIHHDDYEICWMLSGSMKIMLGSEVHELRTGESLQFDALLEHTYEAVEKSKIIIIHLKKEKRF